MIKADRQTDGSFIVRLDTADYTLLHQIQEYYSFTYDQALLCCIYKGAEKLVEQITAAKRRATEKRKEQERFNGG